MTTLCRCDWIDNRAEPDGRAVPSSSELKPERAQTALNDAATARNQDNRRLPLAQATTPFISEYAA